VYFPQAAGKAQALLDQQQRGTGLSLAHQDPGWLIEQAGSRSGWVKLNAIAARRSPGSASSRSSYSA